MSRRWLALLWCAAACSRRHEPAPATAEAFCRRFEPGPGLELAHVRTSAPVYADEDGCPAEEPRCKTGELAAGDEVVIGAHIGALACITRGDISGWTPERALEPASPVPGRTWVGTWSQDANHITITQAGDALEVRAHAEWHGGGDNVHIGDVTGRGTPDAAGSLAIEEYPCKLRLRMIGRYLIVADNRDCGGVNVRFSGPFVAP